MKIKIIFLLFLSFLLISCVKAPPNDVNNVCSIFRQYPKWYRDAKDVQHRWLVPIPIQMAIIHQESRFNAQAMPQRTKLLGIIPWQRPSTSYGYTQALRSTWVLYKQTSGGLWASRDDFADAVDFIGWYANQANLRARIPRNDPYRLYLAYHEGIGGYERQTYLQKPWLIKVAQKVKARSELYQLQLNHCHKRL